MLKKIARGATVALALLFGLHAPGSDAFARPRHAGAPHGARVHHAHHGHFGHHGRRFAHHGGRHRWGRHAHWRRHAHVSSRPSAFLALATPAVMGGTSEHHPLLDVASRYLGHRRVSRRGGPWCRDFVNTVARQAGYRLANTSRRAIDALSLGHRVSQPQPGDLVVMRHHVTIFAGYGGRGLIGLGGNQGRGGVTYSSYSPRRVLAYVRM